MKSENYILASLQVLDKVRSRLGEIILDGSIKVTISNVGGKSLKQNNLWWGWCEDVMKAGIGGEHEDHKEGVHLVAKYRFVLPILERDDEYFAELWGAWYSKHRYDKKALEYFVDHHVSTTVLSVSQMAEALTSFKAYYLARGVNLRDPEFRGLLDY